MLLLLHRYPIASIPLSIHTDITSWPIETQNIKISFNDCVAPDYSLVPHITFSCSEFSLQMIYGIRFFHWILIIQILQILIRIFKNEFRIFASYWYGSAVFNEVFFTSSIYKVIGDLSRQSPWHFRWYCSWFFVSFDEILA